MGTPAGSSLTMNASCGMPSVDCAGWTLGKAVEEVWFAGSDGSIWLCASGVMTKVATIPPRPGATGEPYDPLAWRRIAGPCL